MNEAISAAQALAQRLIVQETHLEQGSETGLSPALRAIEKLRTPLARLSGSEGFRSLLIRALTLASAHEPWLLPLRIEPDGSVQWAGDLPFSDEAQEAEAGGTALLAELIGLLISFVGEALTLQLLRAAWPGATLSDATTEQKDLLR